MSEPVRETDWFRRFPNGGTVYARPSDTGNPYARIDEDAPRPVVVIELPPFEEEP